MDILSDILRTVEIQGSLYFHTNFTPPWGLTVPRHRNVARFHLVTSGNCTVRVEGIDEIVRLEEGDLLVITRGAEHILSDEKSEPPFLGVDEVIEKSGFKGHGSLVWGGNETVEATRLVCGHFSFNPDRGKFYLEALPAFIHVPNSEIQHYGWLDSAAGFIAHEAFQGEMGSEAILNRLAEIAFIQTIRTYAKKHSEPKGLFAALTDNHLHLVLEAIHKDPMTDWTVEALARIAGTSRTVLSERMQEVFGISPIAYLTVWRMELAHERLSKGNEPIVEVSESVGYQSLSSFSRRFKKHFGRNPGEVRRCG